VPERPVSAARGRRIALLLLGIGLAPFVLATFMYYTGWGIPQGRVNHGQLLRPPVAVADLGLVRDNGKPLSAIFDPAVAKRHWLMLVMAPQCDERCDHMLYIAHQIHVALGKDADRLRRAFWTQQPPADLAKYPGLIQLRADPAPRTWPGVPAAEHDLQVYLVDPHGNVIMRYPEDTKGKPMLDDLKRLLKLSRIG
jgi:hypothetical protein